MSDLINLNSVTSSLLLRKLANWGSGVYGNDFYYWVEYVYMVINVVPEKEFLEIMKKSNDPRIVRIAENWNTPKSVMNKLKKLSKIIKETKEHYDKLEDKTMKKKEFPDFKKFINKTAKVPILQPEIYALGMFFMQNTAISRMTIPSDAWKLLEHRGHRNLGELKKDRLGGR